MVVSKAVKEWHSVQWDGFESPGKHEVQKWLVSDVVNLFLLGVGHFSYQLSQMTQVNSLFFPPHYSQHSGLYQLRKCP